MATDELIPQTVRCPRCEYTWSKAKEDTKSPAFCLQCRFPLTLIAGKYRLLRPIAEGGFGVIYEAEHTQLTSNARRVVKVMKPEMMHRNGMDKRFAREVQVTSTLSQLNSHIVRIYDDFGEIPNLGFFYVMELLEGQPLQQILQKARGLLPLEQVFHLFFQLCDAMHAAHIHHVVHRDLKPENLFVIQRLRDPNFLKVIDFGIAKPLGRELQDSHMTQGVLGTPAYMAPEQCSGGTIDERTDIYAMGIILYELLVGYTPFLPPGTRQKSDVLPIELISAHLMKPPPPLQEVLPTDRAVPSAINEVVQTALAKRQEDRFPTVEALEQALIQALEGSELQFGHRVKSTALYSALSPTADMEEEGYRLHTPSGSHLSSGAEHDMDAGWKATVAPMHPSAQVAFSIPTQAHEPRATRSSWWLGGGLVVLLLALGGWGVMQSPLFTAPPQHRNGASQQPAGKLPAMSAPSLTPHSPNTKPPSQRTQVASRIPVRARSRMQAPRVRSVSGKDSTQATAQAIAVRQDTSSIQPGPRSRWYPRSRRRRQNIRRKRNRWSRQLPGCPRQKQLRWYVLVMPTAQRRLLTLDLPQGMGQSVRHPKGFCVGIKTPRVLVRVRGIHGGYLPCSFYLKRQAKKLRVQLMEEGGLEALSRSYCLQ